MAVPKLRFKREDGSTYPEWVSSVMGDYYTERKEAGNDELQILSVSIHTGVSDGELDEETLGKRVKRCADRSSYKIAEKGDLVFNMMRAWQGAVGSAPIKGMVSPAYIVAIPDARLNSDYMNYYVQTKRLINEFNMLSYGVTDFRKRLYWESFVTARVNIPSIEEQKQIATFLESIDNMISLCQDEVECLEQQKKAIMNKIFSQEMRFKHKDGTEFPKWKEFQLSKLEDDQRIALKRGNIIPKQNGRYPVYSSSARDNGYFCSTDNYMFDEEKVTWSIDGGGRVFYRPKHKFSVTNVCGYVDIFDTNLNCRFLAAAMEYQWMLIHFDYITKAHPSVIREQYTIPIPCSEEQQLIANFLSEYDTAIQAAKDELAKWQELKKGLLQHMFI